MNADDDGDPTTSPVFCQQVKVAQLRGLLGRKDAILRDARDHAAPGTMERQLIEQALALRLEDAA